MHVVGRQLGFEEPEKQFAHGALIEPLPRLDGGSAGIGGRKPLQPVGPSAEPPGGQVGHHLAKTLDGVEPRMRRRHGVEHHRPPTERLDLETDPVQFLPMGVDGIELLVGQVHCFAEQEPLGRKSARREAGHHLLVNDALMRRVLIDDDDVVGRLIDDVRIEHLDQRDVKTRRVRIHLGQRGFGSIGIADRAGRLEEQKRGRGGHCTAGSAGRPGKRAPIADRSSGFDAAEGVANRFLDHPLDGDPVAKAHLQLGRMDIDVDVRRLDLDLEQEGRAITRMNRRAVSRLGSANQEVVAKRAAVDEELQCGGPWEPHRPGAE